MKSSAASPCPTLRRREERNERRCHNIKTIAKRELVAPHFASPVAYVFIVIFLLPRGIFHLHASATSFEMRSGHAALVLRLASLALPLPRAGSRYAAVVRRTPVWHDGIAAHDAHYTVAGHRRKNPRLLDFPGNRARAHFPHRHHHRELSRQPRQRCHHHQVTSAAFCWRALTSPSVA